VTRPRILVFLHGTTIMHRGGLSIGREERVAQVRAGERSVGDFASYVPIGNAPDTLRRWEAAGAELAYLSSHRAPADLAADESVVRRYGFPRGAVHHRRDAETYADVVARVEPDVLIEDDCESIGGAAEMVSPHLSPDLRSRITSVVVLEFGGIDGLPDRPDDLLGGKAELRP